MVKNFKVLDAKQAKAIDRKAREVLGISTLVLMENAGRAIAEEAIKTIRGRKPVAIFCGKGNNGGDGFVAARHLLTYGVRPDIFLAGKICEVENEAKVNLEILIRLRQKIIEVNQRCLRSLKNRICKYGLIIDALFGVGLKGEARGIFRDLINMINASKAHVLSIDIPSGLDATTGEVLGYCVRADKTVTFVSRKRGMVVGKGLRVCGKVIVRDLGIPLVNLSIH